MKYLFEKSFNIAGLTFRLNSDIKIYCSEEFVDFEKNGMPDYCICFQETKMFKPIKKRLVAEEMGFSVYETKNGYLYQFVDTKNNLYAVSRVDLNQKIVTVKYLQSALRHISHTRGAFFHIRWEELLLKSNRLILHACCIDTSYGGILFSGVSGVGKSTQGDLWCRYEDARVINGDRPILCKNDNEWCAYGSPYAGSSKCHINEMTQIRIIVLLAQSEICSIRRLSEAEAFRKVFAQLTIAAWNSTSISTACDLTEQLVNKIPVYEMSCTPNEEAVKLLKNTIVEEVRR